MANAVASGVLLLDQAGWHLSNQLGASFDCDQPIQLIVITGCGDRDHDVHHVEEGMADTMMWCQGLPLTVEQVSFLQRRRKGSASEVDMFFDRLGRPRGYVYLWRAVDDEGDVRAS
jgi:hypothetical protein